jgi:hypothetical protein
LRTIGRILGRLIAIALSYMIACVVAGLMVAGSYVLQAYMAGPIDVPQRQLFAQTLYVSGLVAAFVSVYAFAPAILAAVVAEVFGIRRVLYYVICGAIAGLIGYAAFEGVGDGQVPELGRDYLLVAGAGIVAGFVYWFLGGRSAGVLERPAA